MSRITEAAKADQADNDLRKHIAELERRIAELEREIERLLVLYVAEDIHGMRCALEALRIAQEAGS